MDSTLPADIAHKFAFGLQVAYELKTLFTKADKDGNGRVSKSEFIQAAVAICESSESDAIAEAEKVTRFSHMMQFAHDCI